MTKNLRVWSTLYAVLLIYGSVLRIKKRATKMNDRITDRIQMHKIPCKIGAKNFCCKLCLMGPCQITERKSVGVCGASKELIVARNILRFITGGAATHCGHALHTLENLSKEFPENYIKDKAPTYLYEKWKEMDILPKESKAQHFIDISESLHLSTMGVNADYKDVLRWCLKMALIDGYYGLYLATDLEDQKMGKPKIKDAAINLDCVDENKVNIAVHGHEPLLAMAIVEEAKKYDEINIVGVCCTGSTLLAQAGIPLAAHFLLQEDVIMTGLIDALVVDVHCIMPSVGQLCSCYHTKLISTNDIGRFPEALHLPIKNEADAKSVAETVVTLAIENKQNRKPNNSCDGLKEPKSVKVGFSEENIDVKSIADKLERKEKEGIIAVVGCVNPRDQKGWFEAFKRLSEKYYIFTTGCVAFEFGKAGYLDGENIFHLGSCVNNARIAELFKTISERLDRKISELNFTVSAPMPITEKSSAIGMFFTALGCDLHVGHDVFFNSSDAVSLFLGEVCRDTFGNKILIEPSPNKFEEAFS